MYRLRKSHIIAYVTCALMCLLGIFYFLSTTFKSTEKRGYSRDDALIFIGGMPRSGTTLLRVMLDAHPDVRCGEETRIIPKVIEYRRNIIKKDTDEYDRLIEAGVTDEVIDSAFSAFILEIIAKHGEAANRLCNKDPLILKDAVFLTSLFPNAKFIWIIRDGRAVVHSLITRQVNIGLTSTGSYRKELEFWNSMMNTMFEACDKIGPTKCLRIHYEQLVLRPRENMENIMKFLDLEWSENVLKHEEFINVAGGSSISRREPSNDQIVKPINTNALTSWAGYIPEDVVKDMGQIAPMLKKLGYDPEANPPSYGTPDDFVIENTFKVLQNFEFYDKKADQVDETSKRKKSMNFELFFYFTILFILFVFVGFFLRFKTSIHRTKNYLINVLHEN